MATKRQTLNKKTVTPDASDEVDLDTMDRSELKAFIKEHGLSEKVKVYKSDSDDDLRKKIADVVAEFEKSVKDEEEETEESETSDDAEVPKGVTFLNWSNCKNFLLAQAVEQGKKQFERVSKPVVADRLNRVLAKEMAQIVSEQRLGKTIGKGDR